MSFWDIFKTNHQKFENPIKWDMHNHILFGIDDGSKDIDYSLEMAKMFVDLGYNSMVATPHIMSDYYPNNREIIEVKMQELQKHLDVNNIPLQLKCAAEYFMDEYFLDLVRNSGDILSFFKGHVLIETSFMNKPVFFDQLLFELRTKSYKPVLAHPERYIYFQENYELIENLLNTGVKLQINLLSLDGYYSPRAKKLAQWLIKNGYYHFLGTDAHSTEHLLRLNKVYSSKLFQSINFDQVENCQFSISD